jgi:hypothetical protein
MTYAAQLEPRPAARLDPQAFGAGTAAATYAGDAPHAIGIPVGLHFGDGACASGVATSISGHGMFVATAMEPTRAGCVDVRLIPRCGCGGGAHSIRLPSLIMYRNESGIGLLFRHLDPRARDTVRCLTEDCPD